MYVNEIIPVKQLNLRKDYSELLFVEINLSLRMWLKVDADKLQDQNKIFF